MWSELCIEVRNWLTFAFAGLGALYGGMKLYQERQNARLQCDFTFERVEKSGNLVGRLHMVNPLSRALVVEQIVARRPKAMEISVGDYEQLNHVPDYRRVVPVSLSVPAGGVCSVPVFVRLAALRSARTIKMSVRILSRSSVARYSERIIIARLPEKIRKQTDSIASHGS